MIALDAGVASLAGSVIAVIIAGFFALYGVRQDREAKQDASAVDANAVTVTGYHSLIGDYRQTITELQDRLRRVEKEAAIAKAHADRCDIALRAAERRIAALERANDGPSA